MLKKIGLALATYCVSLTSFAGSPCSIAYPTNSPYFCMTFKEAARCHCSNKGLGDNVCNDMNLIYRIMVDFYSSLQSACAKQTDTSVEDCIDGWNCYRLGGVDSRGRICSANYSKCS